MALVLFPPQRFTW